ncbi:MAG: hypothetical protein BGO55_00470 [Sphingobacteriales bacterium 50-39]|nr:helix-turn-helix transcriptional regulator [Sphingobacteriales bacterium]OJW53588.1 MAG: hypothetical protein BGO55_00470 [Sphingobacteriales bacterium 50-39]
MDTGRDKKLLLHFGKVLKRLRKEREWSLRNLAAEAGLEPSYIDKLEKAQSNPSFLAIILLAEAFDISPIEFFPPDLHPPKENPTKKR